MAKKRDEPTPKKAPISTAGASKAPVYKKPEGKLQDSLVKTINTSENARKAYIGGMVGKKDSVSADGKKYATKDLGNALSDPRTFQQIPRPATKGYQVNESEAKRGFKSVAAKAEVKPRLAGDTTTTKKPMMAMNVKKKK